ncbi:MAG: DUF2142 domain-containing protein [Desulfobulbaceae bacterium]|jgi:hypothetical protein|nr:DUF2142 domain-containing protein [Desulfobulbaceae bacterium]
MTMLKKHWFFGVFCLLTLTLYYNLVYNVAHVELRLHVERQSWFKIYWAKGNALFSEKNMVRVRVTPERADYSFFLTDLRGKDRLRIDPVEYAGASRLESLVISQNELAPIVLNSPEGFSSLQPLEQIASHQAAADGLWVTTAGGDGNFLMPLTLRPGPTNVWLERARLAGLLIFMWLIYWALSHLVENLDYVPLALAAVLALVATMAVISQYNAHPDEFVHIAASDYYQNHWSPPRLDDPAIADTYSPYGVTRLAKDEIYYLFNGKMMRLLQVFHLDHSRAARALNLLLFVLIVAIACKNQASRYLAAVLLISPQIWYIFSYCNSDALALFSAFLAAFLLIEPESVLHRFLRGKPGPVWLLRGLAVACVIALLTLSKKNYLIFAVAALLFVAIDIFKDYPRDQWRKLAKRLVVIGIIGLAPLAGKKYCDYQANNWNFSAMQRTMLLQKAQAMYHPDTPVEQQNILLHKKDRGITFRNILGQERWCEKTFMCSFGMYGYHTVASSDQYYNLVRWTALALLAWFLGNILLRGGWYHLTHLGIVLPLSAALIGIAAYHSWTQDFQTQGRYLFPIVPMLGVLYARCRFVVEGRGLALGIVAMFFLSCSSFIAVALDRIARQFLY